MRCPQCGYVPAKDEQQAEQELKSYLIGWNEEDRACLLDVLGPRIQRLERENYYRDLLNFLKRMARERFNSGSIIDKLYQYTGDPSFMDKLRRADRPWPYIATSMVRARRSNER